MWPCFWPPPPTTPVPSPVGTAKILIPFQRTVISRSQEPEALPFCALSYSLVGILSTFLAATPLVRNALLGIVG